MPGTSTVLPATPCVTNPSPEATISTNAQSQAYLVFDPKVKFVAIVLYTRQLFMK